MPQAADIDVTHGPTVWTATAPVPKPFAGEVNELALMASDDPAHQPAGHGQANVNPSTSAETNVPAVPAITAASSASAPIAAG